MNSDNGFDLGCLIFGILTLLFCSWIYISLFCGAFSLLFYFLGKKRDTPPSPMLQAGVLFSLTGIGIALMLTLYTVIIIRKQSNGIHGIVEEVKQLLHRFSINMAPLKFN